MNIHLFIEEAEVPGAHITFDTSIANSKEVPLLPLLEKLQVFINHHMSKADVALLKQNPYFKKFSRVQQDAIQKKFKETYMLYDHENPPTIIQSHCPDRSRP